MPDIVTKVLHGKNLVTVVVNEAEAFSLSPATYREQPLQPNDPVDISALRDWLLAKQYPEALSKAVRLLAGRARSRQEVARKLESCGYMEQTVTTVLSKLEKERLVNDEAFAQAWVAARIRRGLGTSRLMRELRQKGVPRQTAEQACAGMDPDDRGDEAAKTALKLLKRYAGEPDSAKALQKVLAAMNRRGFGYGEASAAIASARTLEPGRL